MEGLAWTYDQFAPVTSLLCAQLYDVIPFAVDPGPTSLSKCIEHFS